MACIRKRVRWAIVAVATLATASCGPPPAAYDGPRRAPSEIVRIRAARGKIIRANSAQRFDSELELLPGDHELEVTFLLRGDDFAPNVSADDVERLDCRCRARLLAGGRYRIEVAPALPIGRRSATVTQYVHAVRLIDESDGKRLFLDSSCGWR